ncbi:MAG: hypothetical protein ABW022_10970 [Actinoplanes sp.]
MKKLVIILGSVLVAGLLFLICGGLLGFLDTEAKTGYQIPDSGPPVSVNDGAEKSPEAKTSPRPQTIREGQWEVGTDVKAGKYKTKGARDSIVVLCTWTIKKGQEFVDGGTVSETDAQGVVTLKKGQTFETRGCQDWYAVK